MTGYLLGFGAATALSFLLNAIFIRFATGRQFFMAPVRERDIHLQPIPRIGGLGVVTAFIVVALASALVWPDSLAFSPLQTLGLDRNLLGLLLAVVLISAVNLMDDFRSLPWQFRLCIQTLAAVLIYAAGIRIQWLSNPLGGQIMLGAVEWLFIVVWLVGLSNVVNWLDGVNGLASGVTAIALAVLFFLSRSAAVDQPATALLSAIGLGAVIGFLPFNLGQAKAFLGDTGSVFLGFLIGVIAIMSGGKVATAFLVLAIPFLDALLVFGSRLIQRQSPFQADQRHLHHRLLALGMKPWQIVGLFYSLTLLFGLIALNTQTLGKVGAALSALFLMVVLVLIYSYPRKSHD